MAFGDADPSTPAFVNVNTNWTTTGGTCTSFTPPANSLVVLFVFGDTSSGANPGNETVSDSGGGAAWQFKIRRAKPDSGSQAGTVAWWEKAFAAAPGSPITITVVGNATGAASGGFKTHVVAGCQSSEGHAEVSGTASAVSLGITSTTDNARGVVAATDWNVQPNMTAGTNQTALLSSAVGSGPDTRVYVGIQNAVTTPPGTVTMSTASPTSGNAWNAIGGFLVPSAGGGPITVTLGVLSETDTIQPTSRAHARAVGVLAETDTIQPVARRHLRTLGLLSEADTIQVMGRRKLRAISVLQETDTIQAVGRRHARTLGTLTTTEVELPLSRLKRRTLGLLAETNSLLSVGRARSKILGLLQETSSTPQISRRHIRTLGVLTEVNSLLGLDLPIVPQIDIDDELIVRSGPSVTTVTTPSTTLTVRTGSSDIVVVTSE